MIVVTRRAFRDCGEFTVWRPKYWGHPVLRRLMGNTFNRRAKLLCNLPLGFGLFWTFGRGWCE